MSEWSHLSNAQYIDRVLESVKTHPKIWAEANDAARVADWDVFYVSRDVIRDAIWGAAWDTAWNAARDAVRSVAMDLNRPAAVAARDAMLTLIAYDDSANYLGMTSEQLRMWIILSENPASILLFPAVIAFEKIDELECV